MIDGRKVFYIISSFMFAFAVIVLLAIIASRLSSIDSDIRKVQQGQVYINDNLCNQQAYSGGTTCQGGDANGGSLLP